MWYSLPLKMAEKHSIAYTTHVAWNPERPGALVIACSDGRLQEALDEFLSNHLGITRYDRLYVAGGPGALTSGGFELLRADTFRRECAFLVEAHDLRDIILVFHGAAEDGPPEATCADYRRRYPQADLETIYQRQTDDLADMLKAGFGSRGRAVRVRTFRCEVRGDGNIQFALMGSASAVTTP